MYVYVYMCIYVYVYVRILCICICLREINKAAGKQASGLLEDAEGECLSFLYPYGATLNVEKPSMAVLSSGSVSFPLNRPVCAFHHEVCTCCYITPSMHVALCATVHVCMHLCMYVCMYIRMQYVH